MSKLKTLKDFFKMSDHLEIDHYTLKELKQEAIKWIEHFKSGKAWTDFAADGRNGQENIEEWIKHFFNIKESDLG